MRILKFPLVLGAAALVLSACGNGGTASADVAATVNGEQIPTEEIESVMDGMSDQLGEVPDDDRDEAEEFQQRNILSMLIQSQIIGETVEDEGLEVTDEELAEVREEMVESVGGEDGLEDALLQSGMTVDLFDDIFIPQQAAIAVLARDLAGDESMETRTVRHILVETEDEGDDVVSRLDDGEDFGELAEEVSIDEGTAVNGGELPPASPGSYVPGFEEAAWESELETVVGPVESEFGFHVLEVLAEESSSAEELEMQQLLQMVGPQLDELLLGAMADADIEVDPFYGEWDPDQQQVVPEGEVGQAPPMPMDPGGGADPGGEMTEEELEALIEEMEGGAPPADGGAEEAPDADGGADAEPDADADADADEQ